MSVLNTGLAKTSASGYKIDQSLRFDADGSAYLNKTWGSSPTDGNKFTFSVWVKRGDLDSSTTSQFWLLGAKDSAESNIKFYEDKIEAHLTGSNYDFKTDAVFRDTSAWYHLVFTYDSDDGTVADRFKIYVNGVRQALGTTSTIPSGADNEFTKNGTGLHLGTHAWGTHHFDGYMAEVHLIDGTALTPTSFGETGNYGEWKPIEVSGLTYGTNGFYLDFADSGNLGDDVSGNGNDLTEKNIDATDQMLDSPTNNFCTLNPLAKDSGITLTQANLKAYGGAVSWVGGRATFAIPKTGKWYWEWCVGVTDTQYYNTGLDREGIDDPYYQWYKHAGTYQSGYDGHFMYGYSSQSGTTTYHSADDVVGWTADDGVIKVYLNNVLQITFSQNLSDIDNDYFPAYSSRYNGDVVANFGQDSSFAGNKTAQGNADSRGKGDFYYTPPSGFLALCTANLPNVAVKPSQHFNTVLYTGNNSTNAITGVGFRPDFVWTKSRSNPYNHDLYDAVRGTGRRVQSNRDRAELTTPSNTIESFDSDGFTVGASDNGNYTGNSVSWNWRANGSGSANSNGSTNSTVSANTDAGFSIVSYTGTGSNATVGHGLSVAPEMVIVKSRSSVESWICYTEATGNTGYLPLNATSAFSSSSTMFNNTSPTASLFTVGTNNATNSNTQTYIAYCFHSVDGYSKMGSYTGNSNADGTFVYLGFRPAFVMWKKTNQADDWGIHDNKREESTNANPLDNYLRPNELAVEGDTGDSVDFLSNGFKWRISSGLRNNSGDTYIYLAFAEQPFKYSNAR